MERLFPLVLVEGLPFTGKSTLSEYIAQQLKLNGHPHQWLPEGAMLKNHFPHVLATFEDDNLLSEEALWQNWCSFVETIQDAPATFVVDSALSYTAVYRLLRVDWPPPQILAWLERLAGLCAPLQPRVIHLTADAEHLAWASIAERGADWEKQMVRQTEPTAYQKARGRTGIAGAIQMMAEVQTLTGSVLAAGWQSLTLDVTEGQWPLYQKAVLDFLGVPEVVVAPPDLPLSLLQSYAGTYAPVNAEETGSTLTVQLEGGELALYGPDIRYGPLIPLSEQRFHLRASGVDITFIPETGGARQLTVFSSDGSERLFQAI
jgi:hypothetical protein